MGICNLKRIDECISARKRVHDRYFERLNGIDGITLCYPQDGVESNYSYFPVLFEKDKFGKSRDDVFAKLREHEVYARKYFYPAINDMSCYEYLKGPETPIAHEVSLNILTLPLYEELELEDVDRICDIILS